jgi:hypothetical protein
MSFREALKQAKWDLRIDNHLRAFLSDYLSDHDWTSIHKTNLIKDRDYNYIGISKEDPYQLSYIRLDKILERRLMEFRGTYKYGNRFVDFNLSSNIEDGVVFINRYGNYKCSPSIKIKDAKYTNILITRLLPWDHVENVTLQRMRAKPGVVFRKLFPGYSDSFIEDLVKAYKKYVNKEVLIQNNYKLELVSGELIRKYYHYKSYEGDCGDLGSSCMRYNECQPYLDIYVENPQCQLAILKNKDDLICARALVWDNKYFDRIYANKENQRILLESYLENRDLKNIWKHQTYIADYSDNKVIIKLDKVKFEKYPFMDSLFILNLSSKQIANTVDIGVDYVLGNTDGSTRMSSDNYHMGHSLLREYVEDLVECDCCGAEVSETTYTASADHVCGDCLCTCFYTGNYGISREMVTTYEGEYCYEECAVRLRDNSYAWENDSDICECIDTDGTKCFTFKDSCVIPEDGTSYHVKEGLHYLEETDTYYVSEDNFQEALESLQELNTN